MTLQKSCRRDPQFADYGGYWLVNAYRNWVVYGNRGAPGPEATFHWLRHTHAVHFLTGGGALVDLQAQLEHAELAMTRIYASALSARRRATVMALDFV